MSLPEYGQLAEAGFLESLASPRDDSFTVAGYGVSRINPAQTASFRERLMAETQLVNLNESRNTAGFSLQRRGQLVALRLQPTNLRRDRLRVPHGH